MRNGRLSGIVVAGVVAFVSAVAGSPSTARAHMEFDLSIGYSHVELDGFYREIGEHTAATPLPQTPYGEIDWDDPGTWNSGAANTLRWSKMRYRRSSDRRGSIGP